MLELFIVVIIATCGNWGWGDIPPPPDSKAPAAAKLEYIEDVWARIEYFGCDHCADPDTTLEHVIHWIYCSDRPEELDLVFQDIPIDADAEWILDHTPYWQ